MALVKTMQGWYDTDKGLFVDAPRAKKQADSEPKDAVVDKVIDEPKKPAKKAKK